MLHAPDVDLENTLTSDRRQLLRKLLNEIEDLTDLERLYLVLKIPSDVLPGGGDGPGSGLLLSSGGTGGLAATVELMPWSSGGAGSTVGGSDDEPSGGLVGPGYCSALHLSNQVEQTEAYTWILSHLDEDPNTCLRKDEVYDDYRNYCDALGKKPLNTADFGKVMKRAFPNVKPRRLGQRGQSKYCYGGMRKKVEVQPPSLPDISVELGSATVGNCADYSKSSGNTRLNGAPPAHPPAASSTTSSTSTQGGGENMPDGEMFEHCSSLILEWAEKMVGAQSHGCHNLVQLAHFLVSQMYVNVRSRSAFYIVAEMQRTPTAHSLGQSQSSYVKSYPTTVPKSEPRTPTTPGSVHSGGLFSPTGNKGASGNPPQGGPPTGNMSAAQHHQVRLQQQAASPHTPTPGGPGSQPPSSAHFQHSPAPSSGSHHAMSPYATAAHNLANSQLSSPSSLTPSSTSAPPYAPSAATSLVEMQVAPSPLPQYVQQAPLLSSMRSPYEQLKQPLIYNKHSMEFISSAPGAYDPKYTYSATQQQQPLMNHSASASTAMSPKRMRFDSNISSATSQASVSSTTPAAKAGNASQTNTNLFCDAYMSMFSPAPPQEENEDAKPSTTGQLVANTNRNLLTSTDVSTTRRHFTYLLDISGTHEMPVERNNNSLLASDVVASSSSDAMSRGALVNRSSCANLNTSDSSADSSHTVKSFSRDELRTPGPEQYDDDGHGNGESYGELPRLGLSPRPSNHVSDYDAKAYI